MSREVRRVPKNWVHPISNKGSYKPLYNRSFKVSHDDWEESKKEWEASSKEESLEDYAGREPEEEDYMPDWPEEERTHYQMYETTSEGTPISPVMESPESLARWLADTGASAFARMPASYEAWFRICCGGYAPSAVVLPGVGLVSGVEGLAALEKRKEEKQNKERE